MFIVDDIVAWGLNIYQFYQGQKMKKELKEVKKKFEKKLKKLEKENPFEYNEDGDIQPKE